MRERLRCIQRLARRDDAIHEADRQGFIRLDRTPGQQQVEGDAFADEAREPLRARISRNDPEIDFWLTNPRGIRSNAQRARHCELTSATKAEPVYGGNHGLAHVLDQIEDMLSALRVFFALRRLQRRELVDVRPGDERFVTCTCNDDDTDVSVLLEMKNRASQLVGCWGVEGVQNSGAVDGEDRDGTVVLEQEVVKSHETPRGGIIPHAQHASRPIAEPIVSDTQSKTSADRPATND